MSEECTCATCGKTMAYDDAYTHVDHEGQTYSFCSRSCLQKSDVSVK